MLVPILLGVYLVIGFLLAQLAIRQGQPRTTSTVVVWTTLWPLGFILARIVNPPGDMDEPYRLRDVGVYLVAVTAPAVVSYPIAWLVGVPVARSFFTCAGISMLLYGAMRPQWFWNLGRMQDLRILLGDRLTQAFYLALGIVLIWLGLFTDVGFPPR